MSTPAPLPPDALDWLHPDGFAGRTVAVIGMARTGRATAAVLRRRGARVLAYERQDFSSQPEVRDLGESGVECHWGDGFPGIDRAELIVPSPGLRADSAVLQSAVERGVPVVSEIELAYRLSLAPIVAFTGTNGKSTTTALCGEMLRQGGQTAKVGGNLAPGVPLVTLADTAQESDVLVAEVSSFQLEWVREFRPRVGGILNVSPDHLERHPTLEQYASTKARLVARQGWADTAIFGDTFAQAFPDLMLGDGRHLQFSTSHPVDSGAFLDGERLRIVGRVDPVEGSLPDLILSLRGYSLEGLHNRENAMAAALAALEMGVRPEAVERGLRLFEGLPHRMETVGEGGGVRWINNSMCTNSAAAIASVRAARGDLVVITGGRSKGLSMRTFGEELARGARWTVLIGETAEEMEQYLMAAGCRTFDRAASMDEAVEMAAERARPGSTVVLIPGFSSFDMFRDFEARGEAFTEAVRRRLESTGYRRPPGTRQAEIKGWERQVPDR